MEKAKPTKEEFKNQLLEKIHSDLCNLEDLTEYKNKEISQAVDLIQKVKLKKQTEINQYTLCFKCQKSISEKEADKNKDMCWECYNKIRNSLLSMKI